MFQLRQLTSFATDSDLLDWTSHPGGTLVLTLLSSNGSCSLESVHRLTESTESVRVPLPGSNHDWSPRCVSLSPESDFVLLATKVGHLMVFPTRVLGFQAKGKEEKLV